MASLISTHLFEVRYRPNSKVLDYRGAWAEAISKILELEHWQINENRIDVGDHDFQHHAFVSFKNTGFSVRNAATKSYFPDNAVKFLKILFQLQGFDQRPYIERLGVRARFCTPYNGDFADLVSSYSTNFMLLSEPAKDALDCKLLDIGSPLILEDKLGKINLMGGPMDAKQINQFFRVPVGVTLDIPDVGLIFDIDYWTVPKMELGESDLTSKVREFSDACWVLNEKLKKLILG